MQFQSLQPPVSAHEYLALYPRVTGFSYSIKVLRPQPIEAKGDSQMADGACRCKRAHLASLDTQSALSAYGDGSLCAGRLYVDHLFPTECTRLSNSRGVSHGLISLGPDDGKAANEPIP